jgi:hypothetical protein
MSSGVGVELFQIRQALMALSPSGDRFRWPPPGSALLSLPSKRGPRSVEALERASSIASIFLPGASALARRLLAELATFPAGRHEALAWAGSARQRTRGSITIGG